MKDKGLIIALDVESPAKARALVGRLGKLADFYKLPPALVLQDPTLINWLIGRGKKVFLDCKWYDIPSQVKRSVEQAGRMGVTACTVHLSAGRDVLKAATSAKPRPKIWGVSVLTSFSTRELKRVGIDAGVRAQVLRLARVAKAAGLEGMVCSPQELPMLAKEKLGLSFVTPGIQWKKAAGLDQRRVASPGSAWKTGASYIVVGRAVLEAKDPASAVRSILEEKEWTDGLAKEVFEACNLKGRFTLRSGQVSDEYFDKYLFESRPELLERIAARMSDLVPKGTELLAGLEMGGIPVAAAVALKTRIPLLFVRKKAKEYGTRKLAEGPDFAKKRVTVVEDVVTTGGAIIDGVAALRAGGATVDTVLCVIDRESGGTEKLKEHGLKLISVFKASELRAAAR